MTTQRFFQRIHQKTVRTLVWTMLVLSCFSGKVSAQTGAVVYNSGASSLSYGSIGAATNNLGSIQNNIVLDFQGGATSTSVTGGVTDSYFTTSAMVAQNTATPAPIGSLPSGSGTFTTPSITSPGTVTPPPAFSGNSPLYLQPLDPYATPNQSSLFLGSQPVNQYGTNSYGNGYNNNYGNNYNNYNNPQSTGGNTYNNPYSGNFDRFVPETYEAMRRFRESTSFEYTFLPRGNKDKKEDAFGINEIDLRMQLAVPCRFIPNAGSGRSGPGFFYIAPGGSISWFDGPIGPPNMSPNAFGAFIDFGMQPQFNDVFALDAWFRFGVFSDFKKVKSDAIRFQGRLMGLFTISQDVKIVAGVTYLDRERVKMLPTGGVVWTPRDDWVLRLTFPNPKISKKLWHGPQAEWWGYVHADYGGGSWYISDLGKTDYNDIRVGVGLEFETYTRINGYFEFGGSFNRELYSYNYRWSKPPDVIYLKTGFIF